MQREGCIERQMMKAIFLSTIALALGGCATKYELPSGAPYATVNGEVIGRSSSRDGGAISVSEVRCGTLFPKTLFVASRGRTLPKEAVHVTAGKAIWFHYNHRSAISSVQEAVCNINAQVALEEGETYTALASQIFPPGSPDAAPLCSFTIKNVRTGEAAQRTNFSCAKEK
ncbi:hypothetical protein M0765_007870 [Variovorax sp. S2]|uniref:hypothetical protein n=1 Tax=Variovorax sp. S12S4 TaxID=3029170 RepID=UPI00215BB0A5|nr:hypothetical protein [Variovorax sp. S12S4]MCR8957640.1 hypothetical protein [Variovorax sp. S12S4]